MTKTSLLLLMTAFASLIGTASHSEDKNNGESGRTQPQDKRAAAKIRLTLNLEKGFSCRVVYDSEVSITQEGQMDGRGKWKINADLLLKCVDVNDNGTMTISQSPSRICVQGTDIEGKHEVEFNSPNKNLQIPDLIRGHLAALVAIKSARFDPDGNVIAARQSPDKRDFDFVAMGKISYQDDPNWVLPATPEDTETVKFIGSSILGLLPNIMGKELTIGLPFTTKEPLPNTTKGTITHNWALKAIQAGLAQLESKADVEGERKVPNEFIDQIAHLHSSMKALVEVDIETGLAIRSQGDAETEYRTMTFLPAVSLRVPTFSNTTKTSFRIRIITQE